MHRETLRLFFGLPLPHRQAVAIDAWRQGLGLGGRPVATRNLHLTLVFLGNLPAERLDELQGFAGQVHAEGFELCLDHLQVGRHGLASLSPTRTPEALRQLVDALQVPLRTAGYELDEREFWPHLTLARQCRRRPASDAMPTFAWRAERFVLFQSTHDEQGACYRPLFHWPLSRASGQASA